MPATTTPNSPGRSFTPAEASEACSLEDVAVPLKARSASAPARSIRATIVWGDCVGSSRSRSRS